MNQIQVAEFLRESNAIEHVYDLESLGQALVAWDYLTKQKKLTHEVILTTHRLLMKGKLDKENLGKYRKVAVRIWDHEGLEAGKINQAMSNWIVNWEQTDPRTAHIAYETIHPFIDGNGRTGRMFMNWMFIQRGESIVVIKEAEKYEYYKWFEKSSVRK